MFQAPAYHHNASLQLSEVLSDIGVNETMVKKRRRAYLLRETSATIMKRLLGNQMTYYILGSQSEATTTRGLHSDLDELLCSYDFSVMQDKDEWSRGKLNMLMIQDESTPPGYCYLQCYRILVPDPMPEPYNKHTVKDTNGRVLRKNTQIEDYLQVNERRQGPPRATEGVPGIVDRDFISPYPFKFLPQSVRHWLDHEHSAWPDARMKRFAATSDCFVVPTGGSVSENKDFQYRISTSLAERCFMFNLNITQIRCYILLKMILKTFINLHGQKHITSYMCKTVLLHCIRSKPSHVWKESNILNCLLYCLLTLRECIYRSNCPHFIIPGNNLMAGKITRENKNLLLEKMLCLIQYTAGSLLGIQIDDLGKRLLLKLNIIHDADYYAVFSARNTTTLLLEAYELQFYTAFTSAVGHTSHLVSLKNQSIQAQIRVLVQTLVNLVRYHNEENVFVQTTCRLLTPRFCTTLGSLMASYNIQQNNHVSSRAFEWMSAGIDSDVSSGTLKLASVFYCTGVMEIAECILILTEVRYNKEDVETICGCYAYPCLASKLGFSMISMHYNEEAIKYITAFCVKFLPSEMNCTPKELQYEMFRSTREELTRRNIVSHQPGDDSWMDFAAVDSIPYLYFLQYKTFGYLQRMREQQHALQNLLFVTLSKENLGHRETAWNLLGQCMEQEKRPNDALQCYRNSLYVRQTNNVARIHICMLLTRQFHRARENNV